MPRILIAGCGYVGQATADLFQDAGWEVEGWTASAESAAKLSDKRYPVVAVDIADADQVVARAKSFGAVIHCASTRGGDVDLYRSVYLKGAGNLLEQFDQATMVFTSSTSVYAQMNGELVTEGSIAAPQHETGKVLRETEELVLSRSGIVARLAGIYGPGRSALLKKFLSGEEIIDPQNDRFVNQAHRDDIAAALFLLLNRRIDKAQIYNVVDDEPILQSECYRWLAEKLNRSLPSVGKSASGRKRGRSNKRVSNGKLRRLGWTPG
ncbi:MAG TPA: NAD-dependent epimerase/dehydratase family protein, partial [Chthoniobacterales bacterium]|nr:NAD-dependent epimerase/dehydratase family protein [Chthoniobacterales bacterium]